MIKEASRIPLTIILLRTICVIEGISVNKDTGIEKNIYKSSNEELIYNDENYDNNLLNYDNEHFLKNIETRQSEGKKFKHNIANTNEEEKKNIISLNNCNIFSQNKENPIKGNIEKTLDSDILNRRNCISNLQSEKRSTSFQHPNQGIDNKIHHKMYVFSPDIVDVDLISRFTDKKNYMLPICDKNEYPPVKKKDNYHDFNGQSHFIEAIKELDSYNLVHNSKNNPNIDRSQLKKKSSTDCYNTNDPRDYDKYKSKYPIDYMHITKISDMNNENEKCKFTHLQINNIDKEDSYPLHSKTNTTLTEEKEPKENIISNNIKADKSSDQVPNSKIEKTAQINTNITSDTLCIANSVSGAQILTNNSELDKLHKVVDNNLLISNSKNNLILSPEVKHTPYYTQNVNTIATNIYQEPKSKPKISTYIPSPTPLNEAMKSNESYIPIQQPVPGPNSPFLQNPAVREPVLSPNISSGYTVIDTNVKNENTNNDLITISIDPKTLQNKILHAEFLKKSDMKKNPDTFSVELEPKKMFTQANATQLKTVNPIQISASKKNNSIIITGGDTVETDQNQGITMNLNASQQTNKKNQQDLLDKKFEKQEKDNPLFSRMAYNRQKKSISISSMDITDEYTTISTKIRKDAEKINVSKLMSMLNPVFVLSANEDETGGTAGLIDKVNLKGLPEVNFEKGNKKVENKILEGFINSIIANYSKDEAKQINRETTEKNEEEAGALLKLLENNIPKRIETEEPDDKKSDIWNLTPILIPESSISKFDDNSEYAKLGPFDESLIKSFLQRGSIPYLQEEKL